MSGTTHKPTGWNTWDFQGFNRLVYLRAGQTVITVQFAVWDETVPARVPPPDPEHRKIGKLYDQFRWSDVTRLGPHAPLGLPARLEFKAGDVPYRVEALDKGGTLYLTVTPLAESKQRVVFVLATPVGESPIGKSRTRGTFAGCGLQFKGATWPADYFVNIAEPYAVGQAGKPATILVERRGMATQSVAMPPSAGRAPGTRSSSPATFQALERQALAGDGLLSDAPAAMMQAITWNTLYDTRRRLVATPVSRDWCFDWRGVLVFCWDTYLVATMMSYQTPELARLNFEAVSAAIDELGFVPNYYMGHGAASRDRSMPPLGSYMIWKTQCLSPDRAWLGRMYPKLCRWHAYWMKHRDGNRNGLLEWGSDNVEYQFPQLVPYNQKLQHTRQSAMYESGLDNSPLFDDVPFNEQTCTLELDDIALSSYYAMDCESLARIAECLGRKSEAARFRREHQRMARRINDHLWDEQHGIYCNRHWDGRFSKRWAPTSFFPLIAGVATPERAARLLREHLLNEEEFWGRFVIPSIARNDPAYKDNDYWRGRIWGPFNFLVAEGLRRYRFDAEAAELARKSLELFMQNWRADGGVYENYNAQTGQGGDVWNAARLYHWGGLLAFVAMQELIDVEPTGYLRVGSLHLPAAGLRNVRIGAHIYDVGLDDGVQVRRNGKPLLDCTTRAVVRVPIGGPADEPIQVAASGSGQLTLRGVPGPKRSLRLSDGRLVSPSSSRGKITYAW
jgi:hypothetical protein